MFEIDVILDEYQTQEPSVLSPPEFEIDVILILEKYQTLIGTIALPLGFEIDVIRKI